MRYSNDNTKCIRMWNTKTEQNFNPGLMLIGFQEPDPDVLDSLVVQEPLCPLT